tara:strand:- start:2922 stop:3398 length:477 start_codon:yes stop_codon:yes gene_type:complete
MDERHHVLPDGEWIQWARREVGIPELFVYYHREQDSFVFAAWRNKTQRRCVELHVQDVHFDSKPLNRNFLELLCMPIDEKMARMKRKSREARSERHAGALESAEEKKDMLRWTKRRNLEESNRNLAVSPFVGGRQGGDTLESTKDALKDMTSGKIYSA